MRTTKSAPKEVRRVIRACAAPIKDRLDATKLIACGAQGCTYETRDRRTVVKVTAGNVLHVTGTEAERYRWIKKLGWAGGHVALPRSKSIRIYKLDRCARTVGVRDAYVIEREALCDVPRTQATRAAARFLVRIEDALFEIGSRRRLTARQAYKLILSEINTLPTATRKLLTRDSVALQMVFQIAHLQMFLAQHGLTMGDIKRSNLGIRRPGLLGNTFDVVVRDIGLLEYHTRRLQHRKRFFRTPAPPRLGGLGGDVIPFRKPSGTWGVLGPQKEWVVYMVTEAVARAAWKRDIGAWRLVSNIREDGRGGVTYQTEAEND